MDGPYQGSSFTNIHEASGEPPGASQMQAFNLDPPSATFPSPPPSSSPSPPPPPISDQAPPGYSSPAVSLAPPSFPPGNSFTPSPGKPSSSLPRPPSGQNRSSQLDAGQQRQDPRSYRGSNDRAGTQTTSSHVTQASHGQPEQGGKLLPPSYGRGEEMRNPSLRDLRGSRENLEDIQGSRQTLDARSADSVDYGGSRQTLDTRSGDYRGSSELLNTRISRPPQGDSRFSGVVLDERNAPARAPAGLSGSRPGHPNAADSLAGWRGGPNDRGPPHHASRNGLSPQDGSMSSGTTDSGVMRFTGGSTAISFPKRQSGGVSNSELSGRARPDYDPKGQRVQDGFGPTPYLGQGQIRLASGGFINLAMDDTISEEPEEVKAARRSRLPGIPMSRTGAPQGEMDSRAQTMIMGRSSDQSGCCGGRPWFMLWIIICVLLTLATLFIGLVPLIFFWQAREEWDAGNRGKAKNSLKWARISFVLALLIFAGGIAGLVVYTHQGIEAIDNAYNERPWYQGQDQGRGLRDYYGDLDWDRYRSDTYRSRDELNHLTPG